MGSSVQKVRTSMELIIIIIDLWDPYIETHKVAYKQIS